MKVLICGSRSITDEKEVFSRLDKTLANVDVSEVITGGAREIDRIAEKWARRKGIPVKVVRSDWKRYGRKAGLVRNRQMVGAADVVVALWDGVSRDTVHSVVTAHEMKKPVEVKLVPADSFSIWFMLGTFDAICVTTNGYVARDRKTGKPRGVMGRGVAYQVKVFMPDAEYRLGEWLVQSGNRPGVLGKVKGTNIVSFPVKHEKGTYPCEVVAHARGRFKPGDVVPGYLLRASLERIKKSANALAELIEEHGWRRVLLPKPGCGAGELSWEEVREVLLESKLGEKGVVKRVWIADLNEAMRLDVRHAVLRKNPKNGGAVHDYHPCPSPLGR